MGPETIIHIGSLKNGLEPSEFGVFLFDIDTRTDDASIQTDARKSISNLSDLTRWYSNPFSVVYTANLRKNGAHQRVVVRAYPIKNGVVSDNNILLNAYLRLSHSDLSCAPRYIQLVHSDSYSFLVVAIEHGINLAYAFSHYKGQRFFHELTKRFLDCLDELHSANILHFDLKPENVQLTHDGEKILFLEIGAIGYKGNDHALLVTSTGYLAPEITRGHRPTRESDRYSLGACLIEGTCTAGDTPFSMADVLRSPDLRNALMQRNSGYLSVALRLTSEEPRNRPSCSAAKKIVQDSRVNDEPVFLMFRELLAKSGIRARRRSFLDRIERIVPLLALVCGLVSAVVGFMFSLDGTVMITGAFILLFGFHEGMRLFAAKSLFKDRRIPILSSLKKMLEESSVHPVWHNPESS